MNVLSDWKNEDVEKIEVRDISGHGGSRTYLVGIKKQKETILAEDKKENTEGDDEEGTKENWEKAVVVHSRRLKDEDPVTEPRMEAAQKV